MNSALLLSFALLLPVRAASYGSCLQADALANTTLGPSGNQVSCRFRAGPGGPLAGIRPFIIWSFRKAGYHAGTGGILKVEIQSDDGSPAHLPSGRVLASSVQRLFILPASDQFFPAISFDRSPVLTAGQLYHAVFSNPHPDSEDNYVSLNALFSREAGSPVQPDRSDQDWALLFRNRPHPAWAPRRTPGSREGFTPILEVDYRGGASQGVGYVEVWMGAARPVGGADRVRELFTVSGPPRRVRAAAVRVRRIAGAGPLRLELEDAAGQPLASGLGGGPEPPVTAPGSLGGCGWLQASFPQPATLRSGQSYRLVLSAGPGARFEAFPLRKGADKGFSPATQFGDGHAEFNDGSGWKGWTQWGKANLLNSDLQFYLSLTN